MKDHNYFEGDQMFPPAKLLVGLELNEKWQVLKRVERAPNATGGYFSTGYIAQEKGDTSGKEYFVKAMDYTKAFKKKDVAFELNKLTEAYLFERNICMKCKDHSMKRVAHPIDYGTRIIDETNATTAVEFLVFEKAEGDIRAHIDNMDRFDIAFLLRALHNIAVGLDQLHGADIAHQDLKPSNVLQYGKSGSKLSDLGRAWSKHMPSPYDEFPIAGDESYAPPEFMYDEIPKNVRARRHGIDLYSFGNLIAFLFTEVNISSLYLDNLAEEHKPHKFKGGYEEVLPYLKQAFSYSLETFSEALNHFGEALHKSIKVELVAAVKHLCEPDPAQRGHPDNRQGFPHEFSLMKYVSLFDLLATKAEYKLLN